MTANKNLNLLNIQVSTHLVTLKQSYFFPQTIQNTIYSVFKMNRAVSKVKNKFNSHLIRAQRTPSAAATVQVSHALPEVRFSCLLRGRGVSLQDGVVAGKRFLYAPF